MDSPTDTTSITKVGDGFTGRPHDYLIGNLNHRYQSEKSFFGYHPSVLKSGMQKYARRAEVQKGLRCLVEMDLFSLLEWNGEALDAYLRKYPKATRKNTQSAARRIRTNMVNRLVVMMSEEVGISAWWMPVKMLGLYKKWIENRGGPESRKYLVDMYLYLTSQRMVRLISDLRSVYLLPPEYEPKHMYDLVQIHKGIQERYPRIYSGQGKIGQVSWSVDLNGYPSKIHPSIEGIIYNLEASSDQVYYWIKKLSDFEKEDKVDKRNRYLKIIWNILDRFIDRNPKYEFVRETIHALGYFHARMGHKEKPIYLYHAVLLMVRRNEIDWKLKVPSIDTSMAEVDALYRDHLRDGRTEMDGYVLDSHTQKMKWSPGCLERFAREGAYVKNEKAKFVNPEYREIYIHLKQQLDFYHSRGEKLQ